MDSINERTLSDRHRKLLCGVTLPGELFGFECGDGWVSLVDGMLRLVDRYSAEHCLEIQVEQVKEKFGLLRVYVRGGDVVVDWILDVAELVSSCTCEVCGAAGRYYEINGWLQVRCLHHQLPNQREGVECSHNDFYAENFAKSVSLVLWFFKGNYAAWLNQECAALGRVRPVEALTTVQGCQAVHDLLKKLEHGVLI